MGASSSIELQLNVDIYLSYPEKTEYIERMIDTLQNMQFSIMESCVMIQSRNNLSPFEISKYLEVFIQKTKFIFVCISKKTIKTVTQIMEMNEIMDKYPILQNRIVYFMMDSDYTPITDKGLQSIVQKNVWYPIYDEDSLFYTTNKLLTLLMLEK